MSTPAISKRLYVGAVTVDLLVEAQNPQTAERVAESLVTRSDSATAKVVAASWRSTKPWGRWRRQTKRPIMHLYITIEAQEPLSKSFLVNWISGLLSGEWQSQFLRSGVLILSAKNMRVKFRVVISRTALGPVQEQVPSRSAPPLRSSCSPGIIRSLAVSVRWQLH
jgi:hypothetical protein